MDIIRFVRERKQTIAKIAAWLALLLIPFVGIMFWLHAASSLSFQPAFPERISDSVSSVIPAQIIDYNRQQPNVAGANVTLMAGWVGRDTAPVFEQVSRGEHVVLDRKITGADGFALLEVPARSVVLDKIGDAPPNANIWLGVEARQGLWRQVRYEEFPATPSPNVVLTLDRPLYQPGQKILARALVVDRDSGAPIQVDGAMTLRSPQRLALAKRDVSVSPFGIASAEFELSKHAVAGPYTVEFQAPNIEVSRVIDVRPYRLPRFKVEVIGPNSSVLPGTEVEFRVEAVTTYGAPVANAEVVFEPVVNNVPQKAQTATTDSDGAVTFQVEVGRDVAGGATVRGAARVTTVAGRTEVGVTTASVAGRGLKVEIFPIGSRQFVVNQTNNGILVVSDQSGNAVPDANVIFLFGQLSGEHRTTTVTDADGIAKFEWTPDYDQQTHYIEVTINADSAAARRKFVPPVGERGFSLSTSLATVGEPVELRAEEGIALLTRDGVILSAETIKNGVASLTAPANARGLAEISVFDGWTRDSAPIWVADEANTRIELVAGSPAYQPGEQAEVLMSIDGSKQATAFGLVGVDEALYALAERSDEPFVTEAMGVPPFARQAVESLFAADPPSELWSVRFSNAVRYLSSPELSINGRDIAFEVKKDRVRILTYLYMVLLLASLLWFAIIGARATFASYTNGTFERRRTATLIGVSLLGGLVGFCFALVGGEYFFGGVTVWIGVVVAWLLAVVWANRTLSLGPWLGALTACAVSAGLAGFCAAEFVPPTAPKLVFMVLGTGVAVASLAFVVELLVWCFVLLRDGHTKASFGVAALGGVVVLGTFGLSARSLGTTYDESTGLAAPVAETVKFDKNDGVKFGASAAGAPAKTSAPRIRSWFPETMVFLPEIISENGEAVAKFEIPDSITTWRLNAYANSKNGAFAAGQTKMTVTQAVFLQLDLPTELIQGDVVQVPVTVVNDTNAAIQGQLTSSGEGVKVVGSYPVSLSPMSQKVFPIEVSATDIGNAKITISYVDAAGVAELQDAVQRHVVVRADGRRASSSVSTFIDKSWRPKIATPHAIPGSTSAYLRLFPSVASLALDGVDAMLREPTGCFEQSSSATYANVVVLAALQNTDDPALFEARDKARRLVELGYQKMLSFRNADGGFGLYPRNSSDLQLTAYALIQLAEMKKVTVVDDAVVRSAIDYVTGQQRPDGGWSATRTGSTRVDVAGARAAAYIYMALALHRERLLDAQMTKAAGYLRGLQHRTLPMDTLAVLANAFALDGKPEDASQALGPLLASFEQSGETGFVRTQHQLWCGLRGASANIVVTAQTATALLLTNTHVDKSVAMLNYLAKSKWWSGGWGSTQATVWALRAFAQLSAGGAEETTVTMSVDGTPLSTGDFSGGGLRMSRSDRVYRSIDLSSEQLANQLEVRSSDPMKFSAQLTASYAVDWNAPTLNPEFVARIETDQTPKYGRPTKTLVQVASTSRGWRNMIVQLPIAPAAFVDSTQFESWESAGRISSYEISQTHVTLYIDHVPAKSDLRFEYEWVPLLRGTYRMPTVSVYPYYNPEVGTEVRSPEVRL